MTYTILNAGLPDPVHEARFYDGVPFRRAMAWVIDILIIGLTSLLLLPLTLFIAVFFLPAFAAVIGFLYRWFTISGGSATWGMRMMGIELRQADGSYMTSGAALMHTIGYVASMAVFPLQLVSIALMLIGDRKQGLTDNVLGTAAINRPL